MSFVIQSGSRQYVVDYGQKIIVNKVDGKPDDIVPVDLVYAFGGDEKAKSVSARIIKHQRGEKLRVVKYRPKSNYHRIYGPRQEETLLEIIKSK